MRCFRELVPSMLQVSTPLRKRMPFNSPHAFLSKNVQESFRSCPALHVAYSQMQICQPKAFYLSDNNQKIRFASQMAQAELAGGDEQAAIEACEIFIDLIEAPAPVMGPIMPDLVRWCMHVATNTSYDLATREMALQVFFKLFRTCSQRHLALLLLWKTTVAFKKSISPLPNVHKLRASLPSNRPAYYLWLEVICLPIVGAACCAFLRWWNGWRSTNQSSWSSQALYSRWWPPCATYVQSLTHQTMTMRTSCQQPSSQHRCACSFPFCLIDDRAPSLFCLSMLR